MPAELVGLVNKHGSDQIKRRGAGLYLSLLCREVELNDLSTCVADFFFYCRNSSALLKTLQESEIHSRRSLLLSYLHVHRGL